MPSTKGRCLFIALALVFLPSGCKDQDARTESGYANQSLEPGAEHPLGKRLEELRAPVRLRPDRRFTLAVSRIHGLLAGEMPGRTESRFENGRWTILYNREKVGDLPVYPDFDDALALLRALADGLLAANPPGEGSPPPPESLEVFPVEAAQNLLRDLDRAWLKQKNKKLLGPAARASSALAFQLRDYLQVADEVGAQALALVALAGQVAGEPPLREEAMLAEALGYSRAARQRAEKLGDRDPLRAFILKDDAVLSKLAESEKAGMETGYLWLRRVTELQDYQQEEAVRKKVFKDQLLSLSALGAHMDLRGFWNTEAIEHVLPWIVACRIKESSGKIFASGKELEKILKMDRSSRPLKDVEEALESLGEPDVASLYDLGVRRAFYRGFAYSGLYRTAKFYLDMLSDRKGAASLWDHWQGATSPLAMEIREWHALWMAAKWGDADVARISRALAGYRHLGVPARMDLMDHISERASYGNPLLAEAAASILAVLDSRVDHRLKLALMAYQSLCNLVLIREALESAVKAAPDRHYWMEAWHARMSGDARRLEELVEKHDVAPWIKARCLAYLKEMDALKPGQLLKRLEKLAAEYPAEWNVQRKYIRQLEEAKQFKKGREVARRWIGKYHETPGLDFISAVTTIGRLYRKEGKAQEGLDYFRLFYSEDNQYGAFMAERAMLLSDLSLHEKAEQQVRARVKRYPGHVYNVGLLARVLWAAGRHGDAARMLKNPPIPLSHNDWRFVVGEEFNQLFRDRPAEEGMKAVEALKAVGIGHTEIMELAAETYNKTNHELAFSIYSGLDPRPWEKVRVFVRAYRRLKKVLGEPEALEWLESQIPKHWRERLSMVAYNENAYELLWTLVPGPDREDDKADFVWLMRAAASCIERPTPKQQEILADRFSESGDASRHYHQYGRFLLGYISFERLLALVRAPDKMIEIAYYVGLKAQSEGRLEEASDWYRVAFSLGDVKEAEYRWSYDQLNRWRNDGKYLPRTERGREAR